MLTFVPLRFAMFSDFLSSLSCSVAVVRDVGSCAGSVARQATTTETGRKKRPDCHVEGVQLFHHVTLPPEGHRKDGGKGGRWKEWGKEGKDGGKDGKDGREGKEGRDGKDGKNGKDFKAGSAKLLATGQCCVS